MVKLDKLPSGNWRARVLVGGGKYKSFTGSDKKEVQMKAAQFEANKAYERQNGKTVSEAMMQYCEDKKNVISPTTYREYLRQAKHCPASIADIPLDELTQSEIQIAVNSLSERLSPSSVRGFHGFLSAVLFQYTGRRNLSTTLPRKTKKEIEIPTEEDVSAFFKASQGSIMEIVMILAAFCGMRRSEILGLSWEDVDFDKHTIRIHEAVVIDVDNNAVVKGTKTTAGTRTIRMIPQVYDVLRITPKDKRIGRIVPLTPNALSDRYYRLMRKCLPNKKYRFHSFRHYAISVMLSLGIPKMYIANYVGHEGEEMINQVYGHIMESKKNDVEDRLNEYYAKLAQR